MSEATVDVVIVNYLTGDLTREAVERLAGPNIAIHVVDNSGELLDDPPSGCSMYGTGENAFYARASNLAFTGGRAPLVLLHNPDVVIQPAQLSEMVAAMADRSLWAVAPQLIEPEGAKHEYLRRLPTTSALVADLVPPMRLVFRSAYRRYHCRDVSHDAPAEVEQPAAACLLVRRDYVGTQLFDERYRLFFNDTDLSRRMHDAGYRCRYLPHIRVPHVGGVSIERERSRGRDWISDEYDSAALTYAMSELPGGACLKPVVVVRRYVRDVVRAVT